MGKPGERPFCSHENLRKSLVWRHVAVQLVLQGIGEHARELIKPRRLAARDSL